MRFLNNYLNPLTLIAKIEFVMFEYSAWAEESLNFDLKDIFYPPTQMIIFNRSYFFYNTFGIFFFNIYNHL